MCVYIFMSVVCVCVCVRARVHLCDVHSRLLTVCMLAAVRMRKVGDVGALSVDTVMAGIQKAVDNNAMFEATAAPAQ
jgi:hypothetical protein